MNSDRVRVLHVITRLDRGGSATNTLLTAAGLPPLFRQTVIHGRTREPSELAAELPPTVDLVEVAALVRHISPLKDLVALLALYRLIRRGRFDLVHTHTSKAGILGRMAARLAGVRRVVHTPHGHVFAGYAGRVLTALFVAAERRAARFTDRIIGLTEDEVQDHLARGIGRPGQFVSIPSGVDLSRFEPAAGADQAARALLGLPPAARLVGSVGRLEPVKGHRYLVEAFVGLAPRFPDLHLALVGDGELLPELRARATESGHGDRIHFVGWHRDVPALLRAFDLFVLPSLNEGMGRALVEAMAAGLPVVASRAGGIPEVLGNGAAGLLVAPADAGALARGIETLLLDPALCAHLGKAARDRAQAYSVETMLARIEAVYHQLLAHGGAGP